MKQDQLCSPFCPIAVSMADFRQNRTKPSGCTELADRMECWAPKHKAFLNRLPQLFILRKEKKMRWWMKTFFIVIEACGGVFVYVCLHVRERKNTGREERESDIKRWIAVQLDLTAPLSSVNTHFLKSINDKCIPFLTMSGISKCSFKALLTKTFCYGEISYKTTKLHYKSRLQKYLISLQISFSYFFLWRER